MLCSSSFLVFQRQNKQQEIITQLMQCCILLCNVSKPIVCFTCASVSLLAVAIVPEVEEPTMQDSCGIVGAFIYCV